MEHVKAYFCKKFETHPLTIGLVEIGNRPPSRSSHSDMDLMYLVIYRSSHSALDAEHVILNGKRILIRSIDQASMEKQLAGGENRDLIHWLVRGEILLDREGYIGRIREQLVLLPGSMREQKLLAQFAGFLRTYMQAKQHLQDHHILDAHSEVIAALHHWAQIVLIESGQQPEQTIWRQLRRVHPGVYKLYEELTASPETLEQRVELVMLACEFAVMNKMKACCTLLFNILGSREEPWSVQEINGHPLIQSLNVELTPVLQKLVKRAYLKEVAVMPVAGDSEALELRYLMIGQR